MMFRLILVPAPDAVVEQIDVCRTGGDPRAFTN